MITPGPHAAHPARGLLRVSRAAALACAALGCATVAHLVTDGCLPAPGLVLAVALLLPGAWAVTGRQWSTPGLAAWLLASQVGLHGVLTGLCGPTAASPVPGRAVILGHLAVVGLLAVVMCAADRGSWQRAAVAFARFFAGPSAAVRVAHTCTAPTVGGRVFVPSSVSWRAANVLRGPPPAT